MSNNLSGLLSVPKSIKINFICLTAGFIIGVLVFWFVINQKDQTPVVQNSEYKQITEEVAQLGVEKVQECNIENKIKEDWNKEKKVLGSKINSMTDIVFNTVSQERKNNNYDYSSGKVFVHEIYYEGSDSPPIGYVLLTEKGEVISKSYNHEIIVKNVETSDESGKKIILSKAYLIVNEKSTNEKLANRNNWIGKMYPLKIKSGEVILNEKILNESKKNIIDFHPSFSLNYLLLLNEKINFQPAIGISFARISNRNGVVVKFPEILVGANSLTDYSATVAPIIVNVKPFVPLLENTYVKPIVGVHNGDFSYGAAIGLNF